MENIKITEFAQCAYHYQRAKNTFDDYLIGGVVTGFIITSLLVVDFYNIPWILTGILPYIIHLGFILLPFFILRSIMEWHRLQLAKKAFDEANSEMLEDIYQRLVRYKEENQ